MKSICVFISFFALLAIKPAKAIQRDTIYKIGDFLIEASDTMKIDFITKGAPYKKTISKGDTLYEDEKYLILGNDDKVGPYGIFKKYKSKYKFPEFSVDVYKGKLATPNLKTDTAAYMFRTQIRDQCRQKGVNFAGHFTIVMWGCGSPCQQIAIVDRLNGKIYYSNISEVNTVAYGLKYRANSRLLMLNSDLLDVHKGYVCYSAIVKVEAVEWAHNKARRLPE